MKPKLVSFKLCPFVQRAVIVLNIKQVDYDVEYIDLEHPPEWFLAISPLQKVPLLVIGEDVIFESAVINEYLDEAYPAKRLHPTDLIQKAKNRSWIEFGGNCMIDSYMLSIADSEEGFNKHHQAMLDKFDQLERVVVGPYFNGEKFSLVDASYASLLQRLEFLKDLHAGIFDAKRHPRILAWKDALLQLDEVKRSTVPDIKALYLNMLKKRNSYLMLSQPEEVDMGATV